jgi:hypothetical protein
MEEHAPSEPESALKKENRRLREALHECRELLRRTEELLDRAYRCGGPSDVSRSGPIQKEARPSVEIEGRAK